MKILTDKQIEKQYLKQIGMPTTKVYRDAFRGTLGFCFYAFKIRLTELYMKELPPCD